MSLPIGGGERRWKLMARYRFDKALARGLVKPVPAKERYQDVDPAELLPLSDYRSPSDLA